ncbi:hypothetical protein F5Y19DRAFT_476524 [Xylariaceae sp. FL1651]|nr:hypothetical protein F5Y19DRAFT_476524 [Xylariaceae sp. FL1651]
MHAPLIWINGFPGSGKLTVATALQTLNKSITLIDNHKLIDPVSSRLPRSHPKYQQERQAERQAAFKRHVQCSSSLSELIVFTDFQSANELGEKVAFEYELAAIQASRPFVPIYLICDEQENLRRLSSQERLASGTTKLTSADVLKEIRSHSTLFRFNDCTGLTIDITSKSPAEAAQEIFDHVQALADGQSGLGAINTSKHPQMQATS